MTRRPGSSSSLLKFENKIYCLALVTGSVTVEDLHPDEWQAENESGHATRTSYQTEDHSEALCSYYIDYEKSCTLNSSKGRDAKILTLYGEKPT